MKKIIATLFSLSLVLALSITAFAASSPSPTPAPTPGPTGFAISTPGVTMAAYSGEGTPELKTVLNTIVGAQLVATFDLSGTPGNVTVQSSSIVANQTYRVLHFVGGSWVDVPIVSQSEGQITFYTDSFSPFAIASTPTKAANASSSAAVRSPQTSGLDSSLIQGAVALFGTLSLAGATFFRFSRIR